MRSRVVVLGEHARADRVVVDVGYGDRAEGVEDGELAVPRHLGARKRESSGLSAFVTFVIIVAVVVVFVVFVVFVFVFDSDFFVDFGV